MSHEGHHGHDDSLADLLDLDGQVFHDYWSAALDLVRQAAPHQVERIVDLGAGSGVDTFGLAERFPHATVVAVDSDEQMLHRIATSAAERGIAARVHVVHADLDAGWPDVGRPDLVWASMSLHHVADPDRVLGDAHRAMPPGALLGLAEFDAVVRFLPDDVGIGRRGLEQRILGVLAEHREHDLPELGSDWPPRLEAAGFGVEHTETFALDVDAPYPQGTEQYAQRWFDRLRAGVGDDLDTDDLATLHTLLDGGALHDLVARDVLEVRGERMVVLARR